MGWIQDMLAALKSSRGSTAQGVTHLKNGALVTSSGIPIKSVGTVSLLMEPPEMALNMDAGKIISMIAAAQMGGVRNLFSLYRDVILVDSHIQSEWIKRKLAVLGDTMAVLPFDKKNTADIDTAARVSAEIGECKSFLMACSSLLDSTLFPISLVEKVFRPTSSGFSIDRLIPVPHHLLDWVDGKLKIYDVDPETGFILSSKHEPDPNRYITHKGNLLTAPDSWGGPMRSILFWWLLSAMSREWWARFLDRYGSPFLVGKFSDDEGRSLLERAFSMATRLGGLVISRETQVEIQKVAASDSGDAYDKFLTICQREKSKLILGQTLSSEAQPTGLGSGTAKIQGDVRDDIRKFDAKMLADTITHQIISPFCRYNNLPGRIPKIVWGSQSNDEVKATGNLMQALALANLELTDSGITQLSENLGMSLQRHTGGSIPSPTGFSASSRLDHGRLIVLSSSSRQAAVEGLKKLYPTIEDGEINTIIANAMNR